MNWTIIGEIAARAAYKVFSMWIKKTQPVDALKELIAQVDMMDLLNAQKRELVYSKAEAIFDREWKETKDFVKDFAFAIALNEVKKGL